jgi:RND family efflux transporter MFP subunit
MSKLLPRKIPKVIVWSGAIGGAVIGLTLLMLVLAGVFKPKVSSVRPPPISSAVPPQDIGEVKVVRQPRSETAIGTVRAVHEASVASKLLARVVEVRVKAGQTVSQGDVLVRLDDADLQVRLKQMESAHVSGQAVLERATLEHDRAAKLVEKSAISRAEFDQSIAVLKTAQADLQRTEQAVEESKVLLEFATIRSPLTGVIIEKHVEPGDTASPGQVLVNLYEPNRMQMVATVRESLALRLKVGDQVPARLDALEHECLATVSEIVPQAEAASRSFTVKVTGPCPPGAYSGMFGRISIPLAEEEVLVVPASAIVRVGQLELVEVVQEGTVSRRTVQLGRPIGDGYEVLAGLRAGDKVVVHQHGEDRR